MGVSSAISGSASSASTFSFGIHGSSDVLLVGEAQRVVLVGAVLAGERGELEQLARPSGGRPGRRGRPCCARRRPAGGRRCGPRRRGPGAFGTPRRSVAADALDDLLAQRLGPDAVDEELQARLAARLAVVLGVAEDAGDRGDDLGRLLGGDEDVDPAREARLRGEAAADAQVEALACRPRGSRPRARCR